MTNLRIPVTCSECNVVVDKSTALKIESRSEIQHYQCSDCYSFNKKLYGRPQNTPTIKKSFYCEKCKYRFTSKKAQCPYCDKSEFLSKSNPTIKDLL